MKITFLIVCLAIGGISAGRFKRITGGIPITIEQAPYFVSIRWDGLHGCAGTLITVRHVLSAGHCFIDFEKKIGMNIYMAVVGSSMRNLGGTSYYIEKIFRPDTYNFQTIRADLAVALLSEAVELGPSVALIPLPTTEPVYYQLGTVIGFETANDRLEPVELRQLGVPIWPSILCQVRDASIIYHHEGQICGFHPHSNQFISVGDSGGPLVYKGVVVGIASWFSNLVYRHSYYTDVNYYIDFIRNSTNS